MISETITPTNIWKDRKRNKCTCKEPYTVQSTILPMAYCDKCDGWVKDLIV